MANPAEMLTGLFLPGQRAKWEVIRPLSRAEKGSGGCFSCSYIAQGPDGTRAFIKALDYADVFDAPDLPTALEDRLKTFRFERQLLRICAEKNLSKIVRVIDEGQFDVPEAKSRVPTVNFLVFELADGNFSSQVDTARRFDRAISLRLLHDVAVGLQQLHTNNITHQDLRPSNVVHFRLEIAKLADLGRASTTTFPTAHDDFDWPGARPYAPPETRYGMARGDMTMFDWRRCGDLFLFGSMVYFMFSGAMLQPAIQARLATEHMCDHWNGPYDQVLPYLQKAFGEVLQEFSRANNDDTGRLLLLAIQQLAEPDPLRRGHPRNTGTGQDKFSVARYISELDLLAKRAA